MLDLRIADAFLTTLQIDCAIRFGMEVEYETETMAISAWHIEGNELVQRGYIGENVIREMYRVVMSNPDVAEYIGDEVEFEEMFECLQTLLLWQYAHEPNAMPEPFLMPDATFTEHVPDPTLFHAVH